MCHGVISCFGELKFAQKCSHKLLGRIFAHLSDSLESGNQVMSCQHFWRQCGQLLQKPWNTRELRWRKRMHPPSHPFSSKLWSTLRFAWLDLISQVHTRQDLCSSIIINAAAVGALVFLRWVPQRPSSVNLILNLLQLPCIWTRYQSVKQCLVWQIGESTCVCSWTSSCGSLVCPLGVRFLLNGTNPLEIWEMTLWSGLQPHVCRHFSTSQHIE